MRPSPAAAALAFALLTACPVPPRLHPRAAEEVSRGYAYLAAGDAERAEVAFRHALAFDPDFPEGENGLGLVARLRGDPEGARRAFERALSLRPDFAEAEPTSGTCSSPPATGRARRSACGPPWPSPRTWPTRG